MAKKALPCPTILRQLLRYEPDTGKLFWRERGPEWFTNKTRSAAWLCASWNARFAGKEAFCTEKGRGYLHGGILGRLYSAHRIILAMSNSEWPDDEVDHINGNKSDNRLINLRAISRAENLRNMPSRVDNSSGCPGVHRKNNGKWVAEINGKKTRVHLGTFAVKADAVLARHKAQEEFGYHANHGRT